MDLPKEPWITFDGPFDPWRIQAVRHSLASHPLLQMDSLRELGKRLEARGRVRTHSDQAKPDTPFNTAPATHPSGKRGTDALADVANAGAWTSLLNVQTDEIYRTLVDEVLDSVKPTVDAVDPGMSYRGGWIFVTSPRAITPFHMDLEHNFIVQILGKKRLYVWDPGDRGVVSERARELFLSYQSRDLVRFHEDFRDRSRVFELEPGMGGYMPSTAPHLVENGDGPSVTMSFTYYTAATRKRSLLYRGNTHLRRLGFDPPPVGTDPFRDATLARAMHVYSGAKELALRALGREVQPPTLPYAAHVTA